MAYVAVTGQLSQGAHGSTVPADLVGLASLFHTPWIMQYKIMLNIAPGQQFTGY